jgi:hypothetical protein
VESGAAVRMRSVGLKLTAFLPFLFLWFERVCASVRADYAANTESTKALTSIFRYIKQFFFFFFIACVHFCVC